ncbi:MAG: hypothetical protein LUC88_08880 [Prevotella sp.]|nr:hypothetical protein [Prevotella sp.]
MEENKNNETDEIKEEPTGTQEEDTGKQAVTYTQEQLDKKVQSENDKIRTEYSKQIKALKKQIEELTPVEKSEIELDLEKRLAAIEAREKAANMNDALTSKGLNKELAKFLKDDADIDALAKVVNSMTADKAKTGSFKPDLHKSGDSMTKEEFKKLTIAQREKIYNDNPELYRALAH